MTLNIGRKGWIGVGLEASYGAPVAIADYVPFRSQSIKAVQSSDEINSANSVREKNFGSVAGKRWSEGDVEIFADPKIAGYFLVGAMGSVSTATVQSGVYDHTITRNNANTPQSLTMVMDRVVDRFYIPGVVVDEVELSVGDSLASMKSKLKGKFPITTTSGTGTTASGTLFSFKQAQFAFGSTVAAAAAATNLKPHDFKLNIKNNAEIVHRHGSADPDSINVKEFEVEAEFNLYFENVTDRDAYYNQTKQAACYKLTGVGLAGGYTESLTINFYQVHLDTFELETGLANFFAEKVKMLAEYDTVNAKSLDMVLRNSKSLYI